MEGGYLESLRKKGKKGIIFEGILYGEGCNKRHRSKKKNTTKSKPETIEKGEQHDGGIEDGEDVKKLKGLKILKFHQVVNYFALKLMSQQKDITDPDWNLYAVTQATQYIKSMELSPHDYEQLKKGINVGILDEEGRKIEKALMELRLSKSSKDDDCTCEIQRMIRDHGEEQRMAENKISGLAYSCLQFLSITNKVSMRDARAIEVVKLTARRIVEKSDDVFHMEEQEFKIAVQASMEELNLPPVSGLEAAFSLSVNDIEEEEKAVFRRKKKSIAIVLDSQFVMDMDPEYLTGEDAGGPTKTEMDQFVKKYKMLNKTELEAALHVSPEDFVSVLNQMVPCVGCRRSAEAVFQQYQDGPNFGFYPLCMDEKGIMYLAKDKITPKFLCTLFHCPSLKVQNLIDSLSKCKSGRRCALHSLESQRIRTVSSWVDVWDYMDEKCQQRTVMVDSKCLVETLERYLKKHRFCSECKSKVLRAYNILTGELDPASEPGFIANLYEGIECCKEDQHLHLMCKTEFVSRLIAKAVPELVGSSRRERHAKTMEIAQEEVLTCLGLCVFERLHRIQQRFREEERTWEIIMCTAIQALRRSFEVAVEEKLGVSQLELLCQELNKEELAKQQRKERKKLNRKRKKEKKSEENAESVADDVAVDDANETLEESTEPFTEESKVEEAQEQEDSCHCEPVETAAAKTRKKKKSGKGKNKTNAGAELPLSQVTNGVVEKSDTTAQKGSATSLCQELRCSSETSRDGGYSSESTSINHDNTTCSSLEGSEIACADDDCCRLCPDFITSDAEPRIVQGPYRSLMEQLEDGLSDNEEDPNFSPPEISVIQSASWGQEREQLRETLRMRFNEMLSKRKTAGVFRRIVCSEPQHHATNGICSDCCERDENHAPGKSANDENPQKDQDPSALKKSTRSGNKGNRGGAQNNRKYKGKNRR